MAMADDATYYQQGRDYAEELGDPILDITQVPGYKGTSVPLERPETAEKREQSAYDEEIAVIDSAESATAENTLALAYRERQKFDIDPDTDPAFLEADRVVLNPMTELKVRGSGEERPKTAKTRHTCQQSGGPVLKSCFRTLTVKKREVRVPKTIRVKANKNWRRYEVTRPHNPFWGFGMEFDPLANALLPPKYELKKVHPIVHSFGGEHRRTIGFGWDASDGSCNTGRVVKTPLVMTHPQVTPSGKLIYEFPNGTIGVHFDIDVDLDIEEIITVYDDIWADTCGELETASYLTQCYLKEKEVIEGPESRLVDGDTVHRDAWLERYVYFCEVPHKDTCQPYLEKGCIQVSSNCLEREEDRCLLWEQLFECTQEESKLGSVLLRGEHPYCLDGNCENKDWAPNKDMAYAMSKLSIFSEMQKDKAEDLSVFKGDNRQCRKDLVNFRDCCGVGKGWGQSFGYKCDADERQLAELRADDKCVFVGTYCSRREKLTKICLQKKSSFCCFQTRLSKLVQTQGRSQLGMGWGDPKSPACQGLSIEQMSTLDFEKIDLSGLYAGIWHSMNTPDMSRMSEEMKVNMQARIPKYKEVQKTMENKNWAVKDVPADQESRDAVF